MMAEIIEGEVLNGGVASGDVLVLDEPLSFWGGFDARDGRILEAAHPQRGHSVQGRVLMMLRGKGSAGTPAAFAESIRNGSGPAAIILVEPDVNIAIGACVAASLYEKHIPVLAVAHDAYRILAEATHLAITKDGKVQSVIGA